MLPCCRVKIRQLGVPSIPHFFVFSLLGSPRAFSSIMLLQFLLASFATANVLELEFMKLDYGGPHPRSRELGLPTANDLMHQVSPIALTAYM